MITHAYAASQPGGGDVFLQLLPFLLIFLIIYFLILRPQQKRVKAHKEMIDLLKKGDTIITQGGLIGKISKIISDQEVEIEIAKDVKVKVVRGMISDNRKWFSNRDKNVYDCSITSREATVCVEYEDGKHDIYVANNLLGSINGPKLLQLSISLSIGVMLALDLDIREYINNLDTLDKSKHRQNILESDLGHTIIDNSFNSNPMGVEFSLETLGQLGNEESLRFLVTPGMVELGSDQFAINYAFASEASQVVDEALIIGNTNKNALKTGFQENNTRYQIFTNRDEAVSYLNSIVKPEDIVLYENDLPDHYP